MNTTLERPITDKNQEFVKLMTQVANLNEQQQEKISYYIQGFAAAVASRNQQL
ncbi:MAG: hypothetical protein IJA32_06720 [Lachnospiraceae bacterium]|nr:hypothetical protein [Lachnospiraceae bacterium]